MSRISYEFTDTEKAALINVAENESIESMLLLPGKSVFFPDEALQLADRIQNLNPTLAHRIRKHPGLQTEGDAPCQS